jgi:flagellar motor switch protein FliG
MLQGYDRAAAVLSLLGDELSQKILSYIPEETAVSILAASEKLRTPSKEELMEAVTEFNEHLSNAHSAPEAQIEPALPGEGGSPLEKITNASSAALAKALETERPEISAYVLSHLPVEKVYETLNLIKDDRQLIEERLLSIKDVPMAAELEEKVLKSISERLV